MLLALETRAEVSRIEVVFTGKLKTYKEVS